MAVLFDTVRRANTALDQQRGRGGSRPGRRGRARWPAAVGLELGRGGDVPADVAPGRPTSMRRGRPRTTPPPTPSGPSCRPTGGSSRPRPKGPPSGVEPGRDPIHADDLHGRPRRHRTGAPVAVGRPPRRCRGRSSRRTIGRDGGTTQDPPALRRLAGARPDADVGRAGRARRGPGPADARWRAGPTRCPLRLPAGPRRAARPLGDRRDPLSRRLPVDPRWLGRRGGVLRRLRVPDHVAAARRARAQRGHRSRVVLAAPGPPSAAGAGRHAGGCRRRHAGDRLGRPSGPGCAATCRGRSGTSATGVRSSAASRTTPATRRCSGTSGAWRSRSSSTSSGRWRSSSSPRSRLTHRSIARLLAGVAVAVVVVVFWLHAAGPGPLDVLGGVDRVNFLYLSTFTRAGGLLLGAAAAFVWRPWRARAAAAGRGRADPRRRRRSGDRRSRLHRRGRRADRGLRLPVAAAARVGARPRRRAGGRAPGSARDAHRPRLVAARRHRRAQLRPVPLALADLRAGRSDRRFGRTVRRGLGDHGRRDRAVLPLRGDAGADRGLRPVVADGRIRARAAAAGGDRCGGRARCLLRRRRSLRPRRGRR